MSKVMILKSAKSSKMSFFVDAPHSGQPKRITEESSVKVLEEVNKNWGGREMTTNELGFKGGISGMSALWVLHAHKLGKFKSIWKPGLTTEIKAARYEFALKHEDWTLEDWKNVILTDKTSIILGYCCGTVRVWRIKKREAVWLLSYQKEVEKGLRIYVLR